MRKRIVSVALMAAMAMSLTACGGSQTAATTAAPPATEAPSKT